MAEINIKRVNFFDGQFLKEGEFLDLDAYHRHMRRRWAYVMFDATGVVHATPADLQVSVQGVATDKKVLVNAGMAIVKNDTIREAKEVVVKDNAVLDLLALQPALVAGDTAIVTLHYTETLTDPATDGDVPGNTRIAEGAELRVHRNAVLAPSNPPLMDGDSYVELGAFFLNSTGAIVLKPGEHRQPALLNAGLIAKPAAAPTITLTPNVGTVGVTATIQVQSTGLDLTGVTAGNFTITPSAGVSISGVTVTDAANLTLALDFTSLAAAALAIKVSKGLLQASAPFSVVTGLQLTGFLPVDEPNGNTNFVISAVGLTPNALTTIAFAGAGTPASRTITIPDGGLPGAAVSATALTIPMRFIPLAADSGTAVVTHSGSPKTIHLDLPPTTTTTLSGVLQVGDPLTLVGSRYVTPRIRLVRTGTTILDSSTSGFPDAGHGESLSATQIVIQVPSSVGSNVTAQITNLGGTILVPGTLRISP